LKPVVAQVPTTDGYAAGLRRVAPEAVASLEARFAADERAQLRGALPATQAIVNADGVAVPAYGSADAVSFYLQPLPDGVWENKVTVRSTRWARMYAPGEFVARVSPTPLLMIVATRDTTSLTDLALAAYERALEPKRLMMIEGGHFDPYLGRLRDGLQRGHRLVQDAPVTEVDSVRSAAASPLREPIPSLANTLRRCHSTVRELRNRRPAISGFEWPSRAS
jgi:fermentation-respiration switch protein FrsA (DUF1100 family)